MEGISLNKNILCEIIQYLNLKDLLAAAKVCKVFRTVIIEFILKNKYNEVEACKTDDFFIVSNKVEFKLKTNKNFFIVSKDEDNKFNTNDIKSAQCENRVILKRNEFWEFLSLNTENIQILSWYINMKYGKGSPSYYEDYKDLKGFIFPNITMLIYTGMKITTEDLQSLSKHFPKLKKLYLKNCLDENLCFWKEDFIKISALTDLKMLETLTTTNQLSLTFIENLIKQNGIKNSTNNDNTEKSEKSNLQTTYKELMIGGLSCEDFLKFQNRILFKLTHLTKLTLVSANDFYVMKDFFITLSGACPELKYLSLQHCNVKEYSPISTLKELELRYCNVLTWNDFKTILSEMSLQTFTSYATRFIGEFEYFDINSSLEHISLHYNIVNNIRTLFNMNQERLKNLKSLDWSVDYTKHSWINATNCPNLEILTAKPRNFLFDNLQGFQFLKSLIINVNNDLTDADIAQVLKHSTLNIFTINTTNYNWLIDMYEYLGSYEPEWANLNTNVKRINLCYHNTLYCLLPIWFNLLSKNRKLSLKLKFFNLIDEITFHNILCNPSLPRRLKSINMCGYIIDCNELERNYSTTFAKAAIVFRDNDLNEKERYIIF